MNPTIARRPVAQRLREWLIARCLAPINLDGSQVSEVTIDGQSVSQVTMDGDEVFSGAIPDSVVIQYDAATYTTGDATWQDDVDPAEDMSITGDPQVVSLSNGDPAVEGDGTDDVGLMTLPSSLEGTGLNEFAWEGALQHTVSGSGLIAGANDNNSTGQKLQFYINFDGNFNQDDGNIAVDLGDDSGNRLTFSPQTNPNLDDGAVHTISASINNASQNDVDLWIDGNLQSLTIGNQSGPSSFTTWNSDLAFWARNFDGNQTDFTQTAQGFHRFHNTSISSPSI